ncbi:MAG: hypothetical protein COA83_01160 [Methylophaga sp.]|nr:MAG: hypothetical protein COA83_01160 [Methylophaga sp.]
MTNIFLQMKYHEYISVIIQVADTLVYCINLVIPKIFISGIYGGNTRLPLKTCENDEKGKPAPLK